MLHSIYEVSARLTVSDIIEAGVRYDDDFSY